MTYAIVEIGGKQVWIQSGQFYDVNKIYAAPGETLSLNKVLLVNREGELSLGHPCIKNVIVKATVLKHFKGRKTVVYKMKKKKNMRTKRGFRQERTRLLIRDI